MGWEEATGGGAYKNVKISSHDFPPMTRLPPPPPVLPLTLPFHPIPSLSEAEASKGSAEHPCGDDKEAGFEGGEGKEAGCGCRDCAGKEEEDQEEVRTRGRGRGGGSERNGSERRF